MSLPSHERLFHRAFHFAAVGMALVGLDGRWLKVNRALCEALGYSEEELILLTFQEVTHPADLERDLAEMERLRRGEISTYEMEKRYQRKDGEVLWARLDVVLVRDECGAPEMYISQVMDITAQKAEAAALKATLLENARRLAELEERGRDVELLRQQIYTVCAWTKRILYEGKWISTDQFLTEHLHLNLTHSISEDALKDVLDDLDRQMGAGRSSDGQSA